MQLVVLAAGMGTRFGGVKQLAPVGPHGEAIMDALLERAADAGFDEGVVVTRPELQTAVRAHLESPPASLPWRVVLQPVPPTRTRPLGTADAVLVCRQAVTGPFAVVNADDLYPRVAFAALADHLSTVEEHAVVVFPVELTVVSDRPVSRAVVRVDGDGRVREIVENRSLVPSSAGPSTWVSMNMWGFVPAIFDVLVDAVAAVERGDDPTAEALLPDVVNDLVRRGAPVDAIECRAPCLGVTYADDVEFVRKAFE